ncbi:hypothetical protein CANINC_001234 [Pichia inconspicua]|uniref:Glycosyltransferase family 32 protein n=1 Tax=Pichia inconspicua TaxID=52247 RepID=A0A4T0X5G0_9ASCO|nr:hypothetical protein CANINC_001234 [[Candida] inconspicua]
MGRRAERPAAPNGHIGFGASREHVLRVLTIAVAIVLVYRVGEYLWTPNIVKSVIDTVGEDNSVSRDEAAIEEGLEKLKKVEKENAGLREMLVRMRIPDERFTLRDKLAYVYPYIEESKFPGYIWQTWKYGLRDENFGTRWKQYEAEWTILNPGFVHDLFNDDTAAAVVHYLYRNIPEVIEAYDKLPLEILRVDMFKYLILFAKGGVYADIDSVPLKPIPSWIDERIDASRVGMVLGLENDKLGKNNNVGHFTRQLQFGNFIMQAKAGHPILREIIATITERTLSGIMKVDADIWGKEIVHDLMEWTAGGVLTDIVIEYFKDYVKSEVYDPFDPQQLSGLKEGKLIGDVYVVPVKNLDGGSVDEEGVEVEEGGDSDTKDLLARHDRARIYAGVDVDIGGEVAVEAMINGNGNDN